MHLKNCFGVLLCALQINYINNEALKTTVLKEYTKDNRVKISPDLLLKTAEILHKINNGFDEKIHRYDDEKTPRISIDYLNDRTDKVIPLMTLMQLVQRNYNADQRAKKDYLNKKNFRVYYIRNPEVLQEYRKNFRARSTSSSSADEEYDDEELRIEDRMLKTFLRDQRRNADFRNINHTKEKDEKDSENAVSINEYEKSNTDFKDDAWDVITQKYQWSKETKDNGEIGYTNKWSDKNKDTKDWDKMQDNAWDKVDNNWNSFKTTKRNKIRSVNSKPRVNEWEDFSPKKEYKGRNKEGGNVKFHPFGRTPIPFIGKRGIYDDK